MDWRGGNNDINYMQCAANIRVVGALIAKLLTSLQRRCDLDLTDVHIIGHSLGAHTAGYTGQALEGIGRITGESSESNVYKLFSYNFSYTHFPLL